MIQPSGPSNARIMIVGEYPDDFDRIKSAPFASFGAGTELTRMLHEAGIERTQCFLTNVCHETAPWCKTGNPMDEWLSKLVNPPKPGGKLRNTSWVKWKDYWVHPVVASGHEQLLRHINLVKPTLIIALGNTALVATTGKFGIKKWRGSMLWGRFGDHECKVIPTYSPTAINRDWSVRPVAIHDLRRALNESAQPQYIVPNYNFIIRPNFVQVQNEFKRLLDLLAQGPVISSTDIETRAGHIACIGWALDTRSAFCLPLMCIESEKQFSYWPAEEEHWIWVELRKILSHPNFFIVGQNWLYDSQYIWRFFFVKTKPFWDTMITQHCMLPGTPKGLDYIASLYCDFYIYWKDDGKKWEPKIGEDQLWTYNCEDCVRTFECYLQQKPIIERDERLSRVWDFQTNTLAPLLFKAMLRGIKADTKNKARLIIELGQEIAVREKWLHEAIGHPLNYRSPKQVGSFLYTDLGIKEILSRKTKRRTVDDEALTAIGKKNPLVRLPLRKITEMRRISVFKSTYAEGKLDVDNRFRSSYNIAGTGTFRLSSSENAFDSGFNFQNIPAGHEDATDGELELPNIRKLFIPDSEPEPHIVFDADLDRADLQVVVWEADDEVLRQALEQGVDLHLLNAGTIFNIAELNTENLLDPEFLEWAKEVKYGKQRQFCKSWVHGTNYGGHDRTMAATVGITVRENERYRNKWFGEHPGIKKWHERTEAQLKRHRYVENKFGYRYTFFDRVDGLLPEALAWVPQSTVGCVINRAWDNIDKKIPETEILIQVHDSLVGQFPVRLSGVVEPLIKETMRVVVPYDRPLIIPVGLKTSSVSWGHCTKWKPNVQAQLS